MSSATVSTVEPVGALALLAIGAGAATLGIAQAAIAAAKKLQDDYEQAREELRQREVEASAIQASWVSIAHERQDQAETIVGSLNQRRYDASELYLVNRAKELVARTKGAETSGLHKRAEKLVENIVADPAGALDELFKLAEEVDRQAASKKFSGSTINVGQSFDAFLEEIRMAPLASKQYAKREQWIDQVERLRELAERERNVASQAFGQLKTKIRRIIRQELENDQALHSQLVERRKVVSEAVAKLRAVIACEGAPSESLEAKDTLARLAECLSNSASGLHDLDGFLAKATILFERCQRRLQSEATAAIVHDLIANELLERGYAVSRVPNESRFACVAPVGDDLGIEFVVDDSGQIQTQAIAYNSAAACPDNATETAICNLVDEIYAALQRHGLRLKPGRRRHRRESEQLRIADRPKPAARLSISTPKTRTVDR